MKWLMSQKLEYSEHSLKWKIDDNDSQSCECSAEDEVDLPGEVLGHGDTKGKPVGAMSIFRETTFDKVYLYFWTKRKVSAVAVTGFHR